MSSSKFVKTKYGNLKRNFKPKSANQTEYIRLIAENDLVVCVGPAGSGKSATAVGLAIDYLCSEKVDKIVITRPTIGTDEDGAKGIGYLPGDIKEKMDPFLRPIFDELYTYFSKSEINNMIRQDVLEIAPLYYCRGRSFHNSFVILDEGQNSTHTELKMITTRLGRSSKMVINGDTTQYDRKFKNCPLDIWFKKIFNNIPGIGVIELDSSDIVRHKLVSAILHKVEQFEKNQPK